MNSIPVEQNSVQQLQRLAAQRQLYADAKTIFGWQIALIGLLVIFSFVVQFFPSVKSYLALSGILLSLADVLLITPLTKKLRTSAALIQEQFDCDVLELPWEDLKTGKRPDRETVMKASERYKKWAHKMPSLENWYDIQVAQLPIELARLACQRSNCWWDSNQRRRYANTALASVLAIFIISLVFSVQRNLTINDFLIGVCGPLAPAIIVGIRQYVEQMESASRLETLKGHAERLWSEAISGKGLEDSSSNSRKLQNEIFENRKKSPLLFDTVFKWLRDDYEAQMNHSTSHYVLEAQGKMGKIK